MCANTYTLLCKQGVYTHRHTSMSEHACEHTLMHLHVLDHHAPRGHDATTYAPTHNQSESLNRVVSNSFLSKRTRSFWSQCKSSPFDAFVDADMLVPRVSSWRILPSSPSCSSRLTSRTSSFVFARDFELLWLLPVFGSDLSSVL